MSAILPFLPEKIKATKEEIEAILKNYGKDEFWTECSLESLKNFIIKIIFYNFSIDEMHLLFSSLEHTSKIIVDNFIKSEQGFPIIEYSLLMLPQNTGSSYFINMPAALEHLKTHLEHSKKALNLVINSRGYNDDLFLKILENINPLLIKEMQIGHMLLKYKLCSGFLLFIKKYKNEINIFDIDDERRTLMHYAALSGNTETVRYLKEGSVPSFL